MKKLIAHFVVQSSLAFVIAAGAGFVALLLAGAVGGVAMGVAPESTFGLVEGLVCPTGDHLEYYAVKRSYHQPGESEPHLECVGPDGVGEGVLFRAIGLVLALTFLGIFAGVFLLLYSPVAIAALIVTQRVGGNKE